MQFAAHPARSWAQDQPAQGGDQDPETGSVGRRQRREAVRARGWDVGELRPFERRVHPGAWRIRPCPPPAPPPPTTRSCVCRPARWRAP